MLINFIDFIKDIDLISLDYLKELISYVNNYVKSDPSKDILLASHAYRTDHADKATNADHASQADHAKNADHASQADHAKNADNALKSHDADFATNASHATNADHAKNADNALNANYAKNADLLDGHDSSVIPKANTIPVSNSEGKLDLSWFNLPAKGLIYYASFDITASTLGSPVTYTFDFTNWYNDYKNNVNPNITPDKFLVIPIATFSIFRLANPYPKYGCEQKFWKTPSNKKPAEEYPECKSYFSNYDKFGGGTDGSASLGDYSYVDYNASAPTYLNNTKYKFSMKLGATGTNFLGKTHSYSTRGFCGFRIYFLGGPEGILFLSGLSFIHS